MDVIDEKSLYVMTARTFCLISPSRPYILPRPGTFAEASVYDFASLEKEKTYTSNTTMRLMLELLTGPSQLD